MRLSTFVRRALASIVVVAIALPALALTAFRVAAARREVASPVASSPAAGRLVRAGDVGMYVQEGGPASGPVVLLVHGTGAWSEIWRRTLDTLSAVGYHAVAVDMPPFGYSERPGSADYGDSAQARRILGVVAALGLERVTLVAHSFGARPAMEAYFRRRAIEREHGVDICVFHAEQLVVRVEVVHHMHERDLQIRPSRPRVAAIPGSPHACRPEIRRSQGHTTG